MLGRDSPDRRRIGVVATPVQEEIVVSGKSIRFVALMTCITLAAPIIGCVFAADLVNPAVLSSLGLNPASFAPTRGVVVLAFVNDSTVPTRFYAYSLGTAGDLSTASNLVVDVEPSDVRFMALDCPVDAFSPGNVADAAVVATAVLQTDTEAFEFAWEGDVLVAGADFQCGDVIELRQFNDLSAGYLLTVIPGR
jgi:hypothetical protein